MSETLEVINTDMNIEKPNNNDNNDNDIDAEIEKVLSMKKEKKTRKPLTEEAKQKKRDILAKSRMIRTENAKNKVEVEKKYKEKVNKIENLDEIIEKKIIEKIPIKTVKPVKDKVQKQADKLKFIDDIVNIRLEQKMKNYKPVKIMSDLDLIKKFF